MMMMMMMMITGCCDVDCAVVADQLTACKVENVGSVSSLSLSVSRAGLVSTLGRADTDSTRLGHSPLYAAALTLYISWPPTHGWCRCPAGRVVYFYHRNYFIVCLKVDNTCIFRILTSYLDNNKN